MSLPGTSRTVSYRSISAGPPRLSVPPAPVRRPHGRWRRSGPTRRRTPRTGRVPRARRSAVRRSRTSCPIPRSPCRTVPLRLSETSAKDRRRNRLMRTSAAAARTLVIVITEGSRLVATSLTLVRMPESRVIERMRCPAQRSASRPKAARTEDFDAGARRTIRSRTNGPEWTRRRPPVSRHWHATALVKWDMNRGTCETPAADPSTAIVSPGPPREDCLWLRSRWEGVDER